MMNKYPEAQKGCEVEKEIYEKKIEEERKQKQKESLQEAMFFFITKVFPFFLIVIFFTVYRRKLMKAFKIFLSVIADKYNSIQKYVTDRRLSKIVKDELIREKVRREIKKQIDE